jgi:hypothetical protein
MGASQCHKRLLLQHRPSLPHTVAWLARTGVRRNQDSGVFDSFKYKMIEQSEAEEELLIERLEAEEEQLVVARFIGQRP